MFARSFGVRVKGVDLTDRDSVFGLIRKWLEELVGRKPFPFTFFADVDAASKKVVFYDVSIPEHVLEFSTIFQRMPQYSIECNGKFILVCDFNPEKAAAMVFKIHGDKLVEKVELDADASAQETIDIRAVASSTDGFLDTAFDITGTVIASIVANQEGLKRPMFTVKVDAKSERNRGVIRSCRQMSFAWSDTDTSYMIFTCRFKMLPSFAIILPLVGKNLDEAAELFMKTKKGVGLVMYSDDISDSFQVDESKPTFDKEAT